MVASDRQACNLEIGITNFCGELRYVDAGNERGHVTTRRVGGCWGGPRVGAIVRVEDVFETVAIVLEVGEECMNVEAPGFLEAVICVAGRYGRMATRVRSGTRVGPL